MTLQNQCLENVFKNHSDSKDLYFQNVLPILLKLNPPSDLICIQDGPTFNLQFFPNCYYVLLLILYVLECHK